MAKDISELETGKLNSLLARFCVPALASSLVTSIYNIVDQLFVGNVVGVLGNAATNAVYPAVTIITSLSLMCGVGCSAAMNLALGKGEKKQASHVVGTSVLLMVLCGLVMTVLILGFTKPVIYLFGCTDEIWPYAAPYARITSIAFIFSMLGAAGPFIIRADGSPNYALWCILAGCALNVFGDWLFLVVFGWGIAGAAWSTVIGEGLSAGMFLWYLPRMHALKLTRDDFRPDGRLMGRLCVLGAGPAINFMTQALVQVCLNSSLKIYAAGTVYGVENTLAAVGVANKVNTLATAIATGLTNGMQPIVSYNYGRGNYARVKETGKKVIGAIIVFGCIIFACYQLFPVQITSWFGDGSDLYYEFAARFFRIFLLLVAFEGLVNSVGGFFSAQGRPVYSIVISTTRQILFLPPLLMLLPRVLGLDGILWSGPITDAAMAALAFTLLFREFRRLDRLASGNADAS